MPPIKYVYIQNFMFVGISVIEILEFNQKKKKKKKMKKDMAQWNRQRTGSPLTCVQIYLQRDFTPRDSDVTFDL